MCYSIIKKSEGSLFMTACCERADLFIFNKNIRELLVFTFIVSGYIPGTDFQLTFGLWLNVILIIVAGGLLLRLAKESDTDTKILLDTLRSLDGRRLLPNKKD